MLLLCDGHACDSVSLLIDSLQFELKRILFFSLNPKTF